MKPLDLVLEKVGGRAALAAKLRIRRQAVWAWTQIPINRVAQIEKLTGIPREKLRPDIFQKG